MQTVTRNLKRLKDLLDDGVLTDEEFTQQKTNFGHLKRFEINDESL